MQVHFRLLTNSITYATFVFSLTHMFFSVRVYHIQGQKKTCGFNILLSIFVCLTASLFVGVLQDLAVSQTVYTTRQGCDLKKSAHNQSV